MKSFHRRTARPAPHPVHHEAVPVERHGLARIDSLLVEKGLAPSRTVAQRMIAGGRVRVDGETVAKASQAVADSVSLEIIANEEDRFVSRGGLKLAGALAHSGIDPRGMQCLDVGQSTGGFSDCLLQAGAAKVVGVEVGHDQLHPRLRSDPRVLCLEALNARGLTAGDLGEAMPASGFELIVCDASFISLALLMPQWPALLAPRGQILALVKPQFEVGPGGLAKGGIVRDAARFAEVETRIREAAAAAGLALVDFFDSPITGGDGNREFFVHATHVGG